MKIFIMQVLTIDFLNKSWSDQDIIPDLCKQNLICIKILFITISSVRDGTYMLFMMPKERNLVLRLDAHTGQFNIFASFGSLNFH